MTKIQRQTIKASQQWIERQIKLLEQLRDGELEKEVVCEIAHNLGVVQLNLTFALEKE